MKLNIDWSQYTDKQRAAIQHFIRNGNKHAAYKHAYDVEHSKPTTWRRNCAIFFNKPKIKAVIEAVQEAAIRKINEEFDGELELAVAEITDERVADAVAEENMKIDAEWVLRRASLLADFNITKFIKVDKHGNAVYDFSNADDDDWYCIQEYTVEEIVRGRGDDTYPVEKIKIKGYDKLRALELVGKHVEVQAFREQHDVTSGGQTIQKIERVIVDSPATKDS